jgi:ubiquinone/menaquinone biosynthesis C-methylase UbiE
MSGYRFDYEEKVWGGETLRLNPAHFRASRLMYALSELKKVKGKVLDVGCGVGDFSESFNYYRPDLKIFAIDISKKAITIAKKRKIRAKFSVADAQKLPFEDKSFEAVTCFDLLEHVENPQKALTEIYRVLKTGGIFHTFIPTEDNWYTLEGILIKLGWRGKEIYGGHPHIFSPKQARKMLVDSGFQIKMLYWGDHLVHQMLEIIYFSWLSLRGRNVKQTVEGYLATANPDLKVSTLRAIKNMLAMFSYLETRMLVCIPGLGFHATCRKI